MRMSPWKPVVAEPAGNKQAKRVVACWFPDLSAYSRLSTPDGPRSVSSGVLSGKYNGSSQ